MREITTSAAFWPFYGGQHSLAARWGWHQVRARPALLTLFLIIIGAGHGLARAGAKA